VEHSAVDLLKPGEVVGPYRVVRGFRGRGGMAQVFEVEIRKKYRQKDLPRHLALKVAEEEHQAALVAEADFLKRFQHPNVVRIYPLPSYHRPVYAAKERFEGGWRWYYAMELVGGGSLEYRLTRRPTTINDLLSTRTSSERRLPLVTAVGIVKQLAQALEHIHLHMVLNLDIKPGNVLFRHRKWKYWRSSVPAVVLSDFGIARDMRYPRSGVLGLATPEYVSPEHAYALKGIQTLLDARSDIFSLGVLFYEMLTGELPFDDLGQLLSPTTFPVNPGQIRSHIPPALIEIVMQAMAKNVLCRFQNAREFLDALNNAGSFYDWPATARRTFAGISLSAALVAGYMGGQQIFPALTGYQISKTPVPTETMENLISTPFPTPTVTPASPTYTTPHAIPATSTPAPTATATSTLAPTRTPTLNPPSDG
jgi:serine/threonine protein kinase